MDMSDQVNKIVSVTWFHLRNISQIRKYITQDVTEIIVHTFITSKLDLRNSGLYKLPVNLIKNFKTCKIKQFI